MAALLKPPRRVSKCRAGDQRGPRRRAKFTRQQVGAKEAEREGKEEEQVVACDRSLGAGTDHSRRCVPD